MSIEKINNEEDVLRVSDRANDQDEFDNHLRPVLVFVHAPWCPYCIQMRREWDALVQIVVENVPEIQIREYDRSVLPAARKAHDPVLDAVDKETDAKNVHTVPHVALFVPRSDSDVVFDYGKYGGEEVEDPYRSRYHILSFIRDSLKEGTRT